MKPDNHCLKWSLLASKFTAIRNPQRPTKYKPFWGSLDFTGIDSPTPLTQIKKVERQNGLAINVFGYDNGIYPLHTSEASAHIPRVNLLLRSRSRYSITRGSRTSIDSYTTTANIKKESISVKDVFTASQERSYWLNTSQTARESTGEQ
jgi:hypothetical protein